MKKLYFLLLTILITSISSGQIWSEDFSTYTDGTGIDGSVGATVTNIGDYPAGVSKWTLDATSAALTAATDWAKTSGGTFSFRDIDGPLQWNSEMIDISSATAPVSFQLTASNNAGGFETSDFYDVYYSLDSGPFVLVSNWNNLGDASHTIIGETGGVDWSTIEDIQISGLSGNTLQIRVQAVNNSGAEEFFLDNVIVSEGALPPSITVTAPTDMNVFAPGTTSVNVEWTTANLVGGETFDIVVNGVTTNNVTSPFAVVTADGQAYNITVNLMTGATITDFEGVDFSVANLTTVANITALRADVTANGLGRFYEITGGSLVTHTDGFRNRKWIQDTDISGVLIYDQPGTIATTYNVGDMVTGLRGTTEDSNGVLRFIPTSDAGMVASIGNAVTPQIVTIPAFNAAPNDYESELIEVQTVTFVEGDGVATFATGQNYTLRDDMMNDLVKRTDFFSADYIGEIIPSSQLPSVVGVAGEFNGTSQIYVRNLSDLTLSTPSFNGQENFSVYPNPTNTGFINISTTSNANVTVAIYDILGKQVISKTLNNNHLNVSGLKAGIYILKLSQNEATTTKKLVIE